MLVGPCLFGEGSGQSGPFSQAPELRFTGPVRITRITRIAPGTYQIHVAPGKAVIEIAVNNMALNLTGVTLTSWIKDPWDRVGIGIYSEGYNQSMILGGAIHTYKYGFFIRDVNHSVRIVGTDVSGNRVQKPMSTPTRFNVRDWVDIFHLDSWESNVAGLYLKGVQYGWVKGVTAQNEQNGTLLASVTRTTVLSKDTSYNSGWGITLFNSSWNDILDNHTGWDVRCEGKTYSAGCDSARVLLINESDHNRIIGNSFTHSGDGYFVSNPHTGHSSDDNFAAFNDGSDSPHDAFESTFTSGDQFYHNEASLSDFGFRLGFSRDTTVSDNKIEDYNHDGIAIKHGSGSFIVRNQIIENGGVGIHLFGRQPVRNPSLNHVILQNQISKNKIGILLNQTYDGMITNNDFNQNPVAMRVEKRSHRILLKENDFAPKAGKRIDVDSTSSGVPNYTGVLLGRRVPKTLERTLHSLKA